MADFRKGKVTEELFKIVKLLLDSGNTTAETARFMKISVGTVSNIRNAETYAEYKSIAYMQTKAYKAKSAEEKAKKEAAAKVAAEVGTMPAAMVAQQTPAAPQVIEHRQTVTVQATWAMTQEMQKTNKLLELISNKLAYIVDELCGTKAKEG